MVSYLQPELTAHSTIHVRFDRLIAILRICEERPYGLLRFTISTTLECTRFPWMYLVTFTVTGDPSPNQDDKFCFLHMLRYEDPTNCHASWSS